MPEWLDRLKDAARSALNRTDIPAAAAATDDGTPESPETPEPANFLGTVANLLPALLLGIGAALTLFAAQIGNWSVLGFLLLAAAPISYQLQRVERRLKDMHDLQKRRRK